MRARVHEDGLRLHHGGDSYVTLPLPASLDPAQISPTRDTRLRWMQSVIGCTHYVSGAGEQDYLNLADAPEITFVPRDPDRAGERSVHRGPRMKIGLTCYPSVGGSGILATALGEELAHRGHEVHFISYERPFRLPAHAPRVHFHPVRINDYGLFRYPDYTLPLSRENGGSQSTL